MKPIICYDTVPIQIQNELCKLISFRLYYQSIDRVLINGFSITLRSEITT
jgi:hypothetical protein